VAVVMAERFSDDVLIASGGRSQRGGLVAFVPITIALLGVAVVMTGGVSVRKVANAEQTVVDPITTGSIASAAKTRSVSGND
jgi:hypothetical protein